LDVFEAIKNRRSIRQYTKQGVSEKKIEKLIDAARWAPSAGNIQPWNLVIVRDTKIKKRLSVAALDQTVIEEAPVVIVVCTDEIRSEWGYGSRGLTLYCLQDTAAATQNLILAAHALGLGACWIGAFQEKEVKKVLNTPVGIRPVAIVTLGHSAEKPLARERRPVDEVVYYENF
jgi:nitroreductase